MRGGLTVKKSCLAAILVLVLAAFTPAVWADPVPGTVTRVVDGDTIDVRIAGDTFRVRLIGIDTPESYPNHRVAIQSSELGISDDAVIAMGKAASAHIRKILKSAGNNVLVETDVEETDRYGRLLAYVWTPDGEMVNLAMVRDGYATPLTIPPNVRYSEQFVEAFRNAREEGAGLWADI